MKRPPFASKVVCARRARKPLRRRGLVLILVLVVVALLSLAAFTFSELMFTERKGAVVSVRQAQVRALADSGLELAKMFALQDQQTLIEAGGLYDNAQHFRGVLVVDDTHPRGRGRFTIVAPKLENGIPASARFGLENESARLNLNTLLLADKTVKNSGRTMLMGLPGMTEQIADAILDWLDSDDEPREFGAEVDYYSSLEPAYAPKNGPLESIEELLLVRDVTPALLFGLDTNRNGILDFNEISEQSLPNVDNSDGSMNGGWAAYLTLFGQETNKGPDGAAKIYVNQDDMKKLYSQLQTAVDPQWATFIVAYRQYGSFKGSGASVPVTGDEQLDLSQPGKTTLKTLLDLVGAKVQVQSKSKDPKGNTKTTILESPFSKDTGTMNSYLTKLLDKLTTVNSSVIPGRININQAPRTVLSAIPGMTPQLVDNIIAQRIEDPAGTDASVDRTHETWILSEGLATLDEMKALMPFVTCGGNVFRAQVVGYFDGGGPAARIEAVFDATTRPARVLFWRDISHLGRGYDLETLGIDTSSNVQATPATPAGPTAAIGSGG